MNNSLESRCEHAIRWLYTTLCHCSLRGHRGCIFKINISSFHCRFSTFRHLHTATPRHPKHTRHPPISRKRGHSRRQCPPPSPLSTTGTSTTARANPQATVPAQHTSSCISTRNSTFSPMSARRSTSVPLPAAGARFWGKS